MWPREEAIKCFFYIVGYSVFNLFVDAGVQFDADPNKNLSVVF